MIVSRLCGQDQSVISVFLILDRRRYLVSRIPTLRQHLPHCPRKGGGRCNIDASVTVISRTGSCVEGKEVSPTRVKWSQKIYFKLAGR